MLHELLVLDGVHVSVLHLGRQRHRSACTGELRVSCAHRRTWHTTYCTPRWRQHTGGAPSSGRGRGRGGERELARLVLICRAELVGGGRKRENRYKATRGKPSSFLLPPLVRLPLALISPGLSINLGLSFLFFGAFLASLRPERHHHRTRSCNHRPCIVSPRALHYVLMPTNTRPESGPAVAFPRR